jgi:hypothetical protein
MKPPSYLVNHSTLEAFASFAATNLVHSEAIDFIYVMLRVLTKYQS